MENQPHEDGPAYLPIVATVSLGSPQTLEIFQYLAESDPSPPLTGSSRSDVFGSGGGDDTSSSTIDAGGSIAGDPTGNASAGANAKTGGRGRPIATTPMGCIYLEPRSLFISRKAIYETFLHGISPVEEDVYELDGGEIGNVARGEGRIKVKLAGVEVSNSDHLDAATQERLRDAFKAGEKEVRIKRDKRVSLTFRRVEKVLQGGLGVGVLGRGTAGARR
jgi:alkylated DNA repair protein alkB family protein 6